MFTFPFFFLNFSKLFKTFQQSNRTKSAVMGGEVEVTTMVRKSKTEQKQSDTRTTEANVEHALDTQEADDGSSRYMTLVLVH